MYKINYAYFGILIIIDELSWWYLMFIIEESGNSWDNLTILYNNIVFVWEVKGTLVVDNKG